MLRLQRVDTALVHVETALRLRPDDLRALYLRGILRDRLGLPGAREDFSRVADALPNAPIGKSAATYLADSAAAASPAPIVPAAAAVPDSTVAATPLSRQLRLSAALDYDTNPAFAPGTQLQTDASAVGPGAQSQLASGVPGAPALSLWTRLGLRYDATQDLALVAGISAFQRFYVVRSRAGRKPLHGSPPPPGGGAIAPSPRPPAGPSLLHDYDFSELSGDASAAWHGPVVAARAGYRGTLSWFGYTPFAFEHSVFGWLTWPARGPLSVSLRTTGSALRPLDDTYQHLGGWGGTAKPMLTALLLGDAVMLEGGWGIDAFDAADYRDASLGRFYSYSFFGHGPELLASWVSPRDLHVSVWGSVRFKRYLNDDVDPYTNGGAPLRREDVVWYAGARVTQKATDHGSLFGDLSYMDNRSNLDANAHDNRNLQRLLLSLGALWE